MKGGSLSVSLFSVSRFSSSDLISRASGHTFRYFSLMPLFCSVVGKQKSGENVSSLLCRYSYR